MKAALSSTLITYDTAKVVQVRNKKVGFLNRLVQLIVVGYIIGFVIVYEKGYQLTDALVGSSTSKIKGSAWTCQNTTNIADCGPSIRVWDPPVYVVPAQENNAFFITTNSVLTPFQEQGICPQPLGTYTCNPNNNTCVQYFHSEFGIQTGQCVPFSGNYTCEAWAWCPIESGKPSIYNVLTSATNFTVLLKLNVSNCVDLGFLVKIGDIIAETGYAFENMSFSGGVIAIVVTWNCDLDKSRSSCKPMFNFYRLDDPTDSASVGYNFRYALDYKFENQSDYRALIKAFGLRFIIVQDGLGGKFDVVPLFLNIGSGLALLSVATVVADFVSLNCLAKKKYYRSKKYDVVEEGADESDEGDSKTEKPVVLDLDVNDSTLRTPLLDENV